MRTKALLLLMVGSAVTVFLPAMPAADAAGSEQATIANFSFSPNPVKVPLGATVQWTNSDGTVHTVTADDGSFGSGSLAKDATFSHTFNQPGTVAYHCAIHPSMRGTVEVEAPPTTAAPTTTTTAAPTTTTRGALTTTTAAPTTTTTAAPTTATTAATTSTTAPPTTTTTLPEQTPPTGAAADSPSGKSDNGVGVAVAGVAAALLLGGGGWWVWRRRVSAG